MKRICIYGKGGIGKSTAAANVAAALAESGLKVAVVGCDPKADSTRCLMGRRIPTVLGQRGDPETEIAFLGYGGVLCIESGGPEPGTGCAGRGIIAAMQEIRSRKLLEGADAVLYDVLGDVVCGGFSMPLREGIADEVYLVTTADFMSLYAANNICRGIAKYAADGPVRLAGLICNQRSSLLNPELVERFAEKIQSRVIGKIPMSAAIGRAELTGRTVLEAEPESGISQSFRSLARAMLENTLRTVPRPLTDQEVEDLCRLP